MSTNPLHYLSLSVVRLVVRNSSQTQLDVASGFFWRGSDGGLYLVTNWHVVTNRWPDEPTRSRTGAVPTCLEFELHQRQPDKTIRRGATRTVQLDINSEDGNRPAWLEHSTHGQTVDVVAISLFKHTDELSECVVHPVNDYNALDDTFIPSVMDDVFVVGFPWGLGAAGNTIPIYKRGSVASDPIIPQRDLPRFLIDCRTTSSMSGSCVLGRSVGIWAPDGFKPETSMNPVVNFIGVYSGRLQSTEFGAANKQEITEIGVCWRANLVSEIVDKGVGGAKFDDLLTR